MGLIVSQYNLANKFEEHTFDLPKGLFFFLPTANIGSCERIKLEEELSWLNNKTQELLSRYPWEEIQDDRAQYYSYFRNAQQIVFRHQIIKKWYDRLDQYKDNELEKCYSLQTLTEKQECLCCVQAAMLVINKRLKFAVKSVQEVEE